MSRTDKNRDRPFMTGTKQLASLEGQQYIVLRPANPVMAVYEQAQKAAKSVLPVVATYPHTGHVTLRGFSEPNRVERLKDAVRNWAAVQSSIDLRVDAIDSFPDPFKIIIARLGRTPSLVNAYAGLTTMLNRTDFNRIGELSVDDWVFHMSIAYCRHLQSDDWQIARASLETEFTDSPVDVASEVEFVWFQGGMEHRECIRLGMGT